MHGAVAADEPRCSAVGAAVLREEGSAVIGFRV
jgi:gamma-glutamyltranspeptidase